MNNHKIGIITQARTTSSRLPAKVLLKAKGVTVLEHHINRLRWSAIPVFVATTINASDDPIISLLDSIQVPYYRGDEQDVLGRFYHCAKHFDLDVIVRVTSDCPLIDGYIIRDAVSSFIGDNNSNLYLSNCILRRFPRGLDFEIFSFDSLTDAHKNARLPYQREHVTPFINQNQSGKIVIKHILDDEDHSDLRWTLDTYEDWSLLEKLLDHHNMAGAPYRKILQLVSDHPELKNFNDHIKQKDN